MFFCCTENKGSEKVTLIFSVPKNQEKLIKKVFCPAPIALVFFLHFNLDQLKYFKFLRKSFLPKSKFFSLDRFALKITYVGQNESKNGVTGRSKKFCFRKWGQKSKKRFPRTFLKMFKNKKKNAKFANFSNGKRR